MVLNYMTNKKNFYKEYPNFDWLYYHKNQLNFNIEKDENKVIEHFLKIGKNKKVLYNKNNYYNNFELDNINIGEISKGFDWEYYLKINGDLNKLFETKHEAYNHYIKFGINEKRIKNILEKYEIKQLRTSDCMTHFKDRFKDFYKLKEYEDENINTVYFGVYSTTDINNIKNMKNIKYIIFGGTDVDLILSNKELKKLFDEIDNKIILYISNNINDRLKYYGYKDAIKFNLYLTDKNIFKKPESLGDSIFIYNGFSKGLEHLYGKNMYEEIIKRNQNFNYIFSNNLNVKNEEMYNIYKKCFIGLRLTASDGNANMVKEMECMEIPVIHNHSNYGLKWKTVEDVENLIHKNKNNNINYMENKIIEIEKLNDKKILINTHTFLDNMAGDSIMIMNYMNMLMKNNNYITLLSKYEVSNIFTRNLNFDKYKIISIKTNEEIINIIDKEEINNDVIFIRNHEILENLKNKNWLYKTILYCLDIHLEGIKQLNNQFNSIITQSEKLKKLFIDNNINENKVIVKEPLVYKYDFDLQERTDNEIRLIYCGTLRDEENILEIIEEFQKIHKERPEVVLKIVYGKIHGDANFIDGINKIITEGVDGCEFKYNLSHRDACYEITTSDIGICWRKNGWGDNGEVSTKVKEYEMYELIIENNISYYNLKRIINCKYLKIIKNLNIDNSLKYKLLDYNKELYPNITISKKFKINFILYTFTCYNLINDKRKGNTENEIVLMCNLTRTCEVYYNDVYINDLLDKNLYIKIDEVNNRLNEHKKSGNCYYENSETFKPTRNYDFYFFRGDYRNTSFELFEKLPEPKIYSNHYHSEFWKNNIIGFQTNINAYLAEKNILKYFECDGTLNYKCNLITPERVFVRNQFIKTYIYQPQTNTLKNELKSHYLIGIIGNINKYTSITKYLPIITNLRENYPDLNILIIILANEINEEYNLDYIKLYKNLPNELYLSYVSQFDVVINTWSSNTCIYSGSNKNLDCITTNIPLICPYSISYADVLGYDYPLFYNINNSNTLKQKLELLITNNNNIINATKQRFENIVKTYNKNVLNKYYEQMVTYKKQNILVDYHNHFYFVDEIVDKMKQDFNVTICKWEPNEEDNRLQLLKTTDIIYCEWGVENAVWYSINKSTIQKLFIRVHRWELFTKQFFNIEWNNVDKVIFITPEMERLAKLRLHTYKLLNSDNFDREYYINHNIEFFSDIVTINTAWEHFQQLQKNTGKVPNFRLLTGEEYEDPFKSIMIYNYVKSSMFENLDKHVGYEFNIGMMGIVPMIKRLDLAIEIIKKLVSKDKRFKLYILGKTIDELPWLKKNINECKFFENLHKKIIEYNLSEHVIFEKYTEHPHYWMQKIGYLLSVSDIEGSHQAVAESMATGTIPFIYGNALKQYKLDGIYPKEFCFYDNSFEPVCEKILYYSQSKVEREIASRIGKQYALENFKIKDIYQQYMSVIL
jgi:hypothetical protein